MYAVIVIINNARGAINIYIKVYAPLKLTVSLNQKCKNVLSAKRRKICHVFIRTGVGRMVLEIDVLRVKGQGNILILKTIVRKSDITQIRNLIERYECGLKKGKSGILRFIYGEWLGIEQKKEAGHLI